MELKERVNKNNQYYDAFYENVKSRTESRDYSYLFQRFTHNLAVDGVILDIGCGTGEHMKYFDSVGYQTLGIEPSEKSRQYCIEQGLHVIDGTFETLKDSLAANQYKINGIWCAASLLHVPVNEFEDTIQTMHSILEENGKLFFTLRLGEGSKWDKYDNENADAERFIQLYEERFLEDVLAKVGFRTSLKIIEDSYWGRPTKWISMILEKK
ncbi:SAM-dependent methyltransferase [Salirhabdus euzebyi]|uniref:SAM-dependent methyltransferase n=1 Tax=Salirhabdus euzebyi TaxID=394506 RepID=A0A841PRX6_9BACI|nr:methyltransferase domain-containing protein [Salirhabdus euzebyi]MBB6451677.1 SAM-dependent methyltransferase [Salirhabdus euzebyi]